MNDKHHQHDPAPREIELKLAIPDTSVEALQACLRAHANDTPRRRHEVTTYFDTQGRVLHRAGVSLRVRIADDRRIQTLKSDAQAGVAADRAEWEWPIDQDEPDLQPVRPILQDQGLPANPDLTPVFRTEIDRASSILNLPGGTVIEAAYDEGRITAGDSQHPIRELELELRDGQPASLYRLACELHAAAPLTVEPESKGARGYRLATGAQPEIHKAGDTAIDPHTTGASAFRQILNAGLGHLLANQSAGLAGDPEGIHQMRIAIRRLRAALTLFQPTLEPHTTALFQDELRRVGRIFGQARDWDVFCLQILPDVLQSEQDAGWRDLLAQPAAAARAHAHKAFAQEIRDPAFTRLLLGLAAWAQEPRLPGDPPPPKSIAHLCPPLLDRLATKVSHRGRHIRHRSKTELHALRKSLKKLRYTIDFLGSVFDPVPLESYLHDCKKLQQTLGDINDTVAATTLAEGLVKDRRLDLAPAVGTLAEQLGQRRAHALGHLAKRWQSFADQPRFWA